MMVTTHAAVGLTLGVALGTVAPEYALTAAVAGTVGGTVPDLDLLAGVHRKTLHFPVLGWPPAIVAAGVAASAPSHLTVAIALFLTAAAVHALSDVLGAGEELRPWERTTDEAVYCHATGRWLRARYVVRYDGSPEDLLLTVAFAVPGVVAFSGPVRWVCVAGIVGAAAYVAVRRRVPAYVSRIRTER